MGFVSAYVQQYFYLIVEVLFLSLDCCFTFHIFIFVIANVFKKNKNNIIIYILQWFGITKILWNSNKSMKQSISDQKVTHHWIICLLAAWRLADHQCSLAVQYPCTGWDWRLFFPSTFYLFSKSFVLFHFIYFFCISFYVWFFAMHLNKDISCLAGPRIVCLD